MSKKEVPKRKTRVKKGALLKVKRRTASKEKQIGEVRQVIAEQKVTFEKVAPFVEKREEPYELPAGYGDNKIVLMVRDPYWAYAYWEITRDKQDEVRVQMNEEDWINSRHILRIYDVTDIKFNGSNAHRYFDIELTGHANNWYINMGVPDRSYCVDIGVLTEDRKFYTLVRSNTITLPRDTISSVIDEEWLMTEEEYERMFRLSGGLYDRGGGSEEIGRMISKRLQQEVSSGAISSISSPIGKPKEKGFRLVVNTELIVYGSTEPDAMATIEDRPIKLREDGSFSLRFALPDGEYFFPVKAKSVDNSKEITITPAVKRWNKT